VARDNTVRYGWRTLQLLPDSNRRSYAGIHVDLREYHDGRLEVASDDRIINTREAPQDSLKPLGNVAGVVIKHPIGRVEVTGLGRQKNGLSQLLISPGSTTARHPTFRQQARWDAVQEARSQGLSQRATARLLGMSRKTVRRYKSAVSPPLNRPLSRNA